MNNLTTIEIVNKPLKTDRKTLVKLNYYLGNNLKSFGVQFVKMHSYKGQTWEENRGRTFNVKKLSTAVEIFNNYVTEQLFIPISKEVLTHD
jgi:hypothetical protein